MLGQTGRLAGYHVHDIGLTEDKILPYGRSWHQITFDQSRAAVRLFNIDRIRQAMILDTHYQFPTDFYLDDFKTTPGV